MAVGFGFSISDVCNAFKVIRTSVNALDRKKGATANFHSLALEIQSVEDGLEAAEKLLENEDLQSTQRAALERAVGSCHDTIRDFMESISKYQPHLRDETSGFSSRFRKIQWALCKKDDMADFQAQLARQSSSINMLLITFQRRSRSNTTSTYSGDGTMSKLKQSQDERIQEMLSSMSVENRQFFVMVLEQNNQMMHTLQEMRQLLYVQRQIPSQVTLQQPVLLLDPFGKLAPFHLEFVDSPECFIAILRTRFAQAGIKPAGLSKLDNREFVIEQTKHQMPVNLDHGWERAWEPGERYDMRIIFHRFCCRSSTCPSCRKINNDDVLHIRCHGCGLEYQKLEAIHPASNDWSSYVAKQTEVEVADDEFPYLLEHPQRGPELKVFRPFEDSGDEDLTEYRRVQVISQPLALIDEQFPALILVEDFARFAWLVRDVPLGLSIYQPDITELGSRARRYIDEKNAFNTEFSSFTEIDQMRKHLMESSRPLRQEIDRLVRKLCEDFSTQDLIKFVKTRRMESEMTGYFIGVLSRMAPVSDPARSRRSKTVKASSKEKMEWQMFDSRSR